MEGQMQEGDKGYRRATNGAWISSWKMVSYLLGWRLVCCVSSGD